jgi:hypothetical protein
LFFQTSTKPFRGYFIVNAKLGKKRKCQECGARFYDLNKEEIICPKCNAIYQDSSTENADLSEEEILLSEDIDLDEFDSDIDLDDDDEDKDAEYIEDVSDLGSDDDDMAEIIDHSDTKDMDFN